MTAERFSAMLFLLVPQVIALLTADGQTEEETATAQFYCSRLYAQLEDEPTKLWHLSAHALVEMFREEQETGKITYPEEA